MHEEIFEEKNVQQNSFLKDILRIAFPNFS